MGDEKKTFKIVIEGFVFDDGKNIFVPVNGIFVRAIDDIVQENCVREEMESFIEDAKNDERKIQPFSTTVELDTSVVRGNITEVAGIDRKKQGGAGKTAKYSKFEERKKQYIRTQLASGSTPRKETLEKYRITKEELDELTSAMKKVEIKPEEDEEEEEENTRDLLGYDEFTPAKSGAKTAKKTTKKK